MKKLISKYKFELIGAPIGALTGFTYWYYVGCASGNCAITSNPLISTAYGALMGGLIFGLFNSKNKINK